jgi:CRP-like cAMP-binding protein
MENALLKLKESDVLFVEGEMINEMFIIKSGEIGIFKEKGDRLDSFRNLDAGNLVGEVSIFTGEKHRGATAIATMDSEIVKIPKDAIIKVINSRPDWLGEVMKDITNALIYTGKVMRDQSIFQDDMTREFKILTPQMEGLFLNSIDDYRRKSGVVRPSV